MFYPVATAADHSCICEPLSVVESDLFANSGYEEFGLFNLIEDGIDRASYMRENDEWWPGCPDTVTTSADGTVTSPRDDCNANDYQFWNEILCQCQIDYDYECNAEPCPDQMTPGVQEANTLCQCVDIPSLYPFYPSWASDNLINQAQRNQLSTPEPPCGANCGPPPTNLVDIPAGCEFEANAHMCPFGDNSYWNPYACQCLFDTSICYGTSDSSFTGDSSTVQGCEENSDYMPKIYNGQISCVCEPEDTIY